MNKLSLAQRRMLLDVGKKLCPKCGIVKLLSEYSSYNGRSLGGVQHSCKSCTAIRIAKWTKDKRSASDPRFLIAAKLTTSRGAAKTHGYIACNATVEELVPLFTTKCHICNTECGITICLDHCHTTGKFRGFICRACNCILGYAQDNPKRLDKLASYLRDKIQERVAIITNDVHSEADSNLRADSNDEPLDVEEPDISQEEPEAS